MNQGLRICERLDFSEKLLKLAKTPRRVGENQTANLSRSDRKLIHLARALIYNPEVIILLLNPITKF